MIDAKTVAELRARTGAGMGDCKKALEEANGDMEKAVEVLRKTGAAKAAKKSAERETAEGLVESYTHSNGKIGVLVELQCETDFVARNPEFKQLAHEIAMQIVAMAPLYVQVSDIPPTMVEKEKHIYMTEDALANKPEEIKAKIVEGKLNKWYEDICLLNQLWIKDDTKTVAQLIDENVAKIGEKIVVSRFSRIELSAVKTEEGL
ncbi:MAG: translation elongation factor Ts [Patescibacteria group bacterium]